jgi:hypothetical protein
VTFTRLSGPRSRPTASQKNLLASVIQAGTARSVARNSTRTQREIRSRRLRIDLLKIIRTVYLCYGDRLRGRGERVSSNAYFGLKFVIRHPNLRCGYSSIVAWPIKTLGFDRYRICFTLTKPGYKSQSLALLPQTTGHISLGRFFSFRCQRPKVSASTSSLLRMILEFLGPGPLS